MERWRALGLDTSSHADLLVKRLSPLAELSGKDLTLIDSLAGQTEEVAAGTQLIREGEALELAAAAHGRLGVPIPHSSGWSKADL